MAFTDPEEHFKHLAFLVELEQKEEIESFHREFTQLSPEERELTVIFMVDVSRSEYFGTRGRTKS